jgi:hypothetical protein
MSGQVDHDLLAEQRSQWNEPLALVIHVVIGAIDGGQVSKEYTYSNDAHPLKHIQSTLHQ